MRRVSIIAVVMALSMVGMVYGTAVAERCSASFCVTASNSMNGTTGGVTISLNGTGKDAGSVRYECYLGPIPFICDISFYQSYANTPFATPVFTGGNVPSRNFTLGTSPVTGQSSWNYKLTGTISGNATNSLSSQAKADQRSSGFYVGTGTGSGHQVDDNYRQTVRVQ